MKDTEILRLFREGLNYAELASRAGYHVSQIQPIYDALDRCRGPILPKLPVGPLVGPGVAEELRTLICTFVEGI